LFVGAAAGALGVLLTAALVAMSLGLSGEPFLPAAKAVLLLYVPLALLEALMTATVLSFLRRVAPEVLLRGEVPRA
jgi:cobalt/nickel transport system permease protein